MTRLRDEPDGAYGSSADELLSGYAPWVDETTAGFILCLHKTLAESEPMSTLMSCLPEHERLAVLGKQLSHLVSVFEPGLTKAAHQERSLAMGRLHILIGVEETWLIKLYNAYHDHLHMRLMDRNDDPKNIHRLMRVLDRRLRLDLEGQAIGIKAAEVEIVAIFKAVLERTQKATSLQDLYSGILNELTRLDGMLVVFVARLDPEGRFEIEESAGPQAEAYLNAMMSGQIPRIHVKPTDEARGPAARAWMTGTFEPVAAYQTDKSLHPWKAFGATLGFRSSAALPLVNEDGETFALLSMYSSWIGFFNVPLRHMLFQQIQMTVSTAALRHRQHEIIPVRTKMHYLDLLTNGRVEVEYQPILGHRLINRIQIRADASFTRAI